MITSELAPSGDRVEAQGGNGPRVQPRGIVLVLTESDLRIEQISANVEQLTGLSAQCACDEALGVLLSEPDARELSARLYAAPNGAVNAYALTVCGPARSFAAECTAYRSDSRFIVELEAAADASDPAADCNLPAAVTRLRTAPTIDALLASAVHDIAQLVDFDRVYIYRLESDGGRVVVAETPAAEPGRSYLGQHFRMVDRRNREPALDIRSPLHFIADTDYEPVDMVASATGGAVRYADLSRAMLRDSEEFRVEYRDTGVRAAVLVAVIIGDRLWGYIAAHNSRPRRLSIATRSACELMGHLLGWRLAAEEQTQREQQVAREAELRTAVNRALESQIEVGAAVIDCAPQLLDLFAADGIATRVNGVTRRSGNVPVDDATLSHIAAALFAQAGSTDIAATSRLVSLAPAMRGSRTAGVLAIRRAEDSADVLFVFRPELIRTQVWGDDPARADLAAQPRSSRETIRDESRAWTADDITAAQRLRTHILQSVLARTAVLREPIVSITAHLEHRNARAEALIRLQDDVAAALPSRAAVIDVILEFAQSQTGAGGCALETLDGGEIVFDAARGSLAPYVGRRTSQAGSLSAISAALHQALLCDDTATEVETVEREFCRQLGIGAMIVVPIVLSASNTFVLKVVAAQPSAFSDNDVQILKLAATNLRSALRAAQKFAAITAAELEQRTYAHQLRALHTIASTTTSRRKEQIEAALRLGLEQLNLEWAFLGVIDYNAQEFFIESSVSTNGRIVIPAGTRFPLDCEVIARVATSKRAFIVEDVSKLAEPPVYGGWNACITVPLFIGGVKYGAIGFTACAARTEPFSEANIEFLSVAGELIASAIERGLQREQLETGQSQYRALIDAIPQKMWLIDAAKQFAYVNERWTQYTGLTLEHSRVVGTETIYHPADAAELRLRPLPAGELVCEVRLRRADGAFRWHLLRCVPFQTSGGRVDTWLFTATDIEDRKSAETLLADVHDAALAATEAKSRFLATMSHEIRTPMNGVIGMTELLLLTPLNDEQRDYTEIIRDSGHSLLRVLNDILDYSKIEAGKLELETVQFDLPGQVESVVELLRPGFTGKGVDLQTQIAPDLRTSVVGDPGRLRQILLNLAGNALKFTAKSGSVRITVAATTADGDVSPVRFTIEDTGIGMPPQVLERLFQPFSQGDESTTRKFGGTGLGLSISAELVALMGGQIGVQSRVGVGSEFWFVVPFPVAPNSQKVADKHARTAPLNEPAPIRAERILLVEDNEINTFLALKQLGRLGFAVTSVVDGRQAVETVAREDYDLVLMDCHMPEMDGFEATRAIRKGETGSGTRLPIVAMTADARDEDHENCLRAGMDDYISKPTNLDSLKAVLDRWLPVPERRRASRSGNGPLSSTPTLGMSMLLELFNGDRSAVLDLLAAALNTIDVDLKRIEAAGAARDFAGVVEAAHRLKGTSGSIRAGRLVEISGTIEVEGRATPPVLGPTLLAELRAAVAALNAEVQQKSVDPSPPR